MKKLIRNKKGQGLVEYGLIVAGVALISACSISIFGHKVCDLIGAVATVLPCAHGDDNAPLTAGKLIETTKDGTTGAIEVDAAGIAANSDTARLGLNVGLDSAEDFGGLILEP